MNTKLVIIGASGHGKVVVDIALQLQKYEEILFLDDNGDIDNCMGIPIIGKISDAGQYIGEADFFVAIGNSQLRRRVTEELIQLHASITTLVHPKATIGKNVTLGQGTVVMAGAVINPDCSIGQNCIINTCASVDHDCRLEDYVHVSVGAHICGTVEIGLHTWIGSGATVKNNVKICGDCLVGAGAVVVKDIEKAGTYIGIPASNVM